MAQLAVTLSGAQAPASRASVSRGNPLKRWFGDRKVNTKILAAVGVVAIIASSIGLFAIMKLATVNQSATTIYRQGMLPVTSLTAIRGHVFQVRLDVANQAISTTKDDKAKYEEAVRVDDAAVDAAVADYQKLATQPKAVDEVVAQLTKYRVIRDEQLLPAGRASNMAQWSQVRDTVAAPIITKMMDGIQTLVDEGKANAAAQANAATNTYQSARSITLGLLVGGLLLAVFLAMMIGRTIVGPMRKVNAALVSVAEGDLTHHVDVDTRDELGTMAASVNTATENLRATVSTMADNAQALAAASEQLSNTSNQIAAAAEETSTQAEVVAAAAEQVSTNVQTVAAGTEEMGASIRDIAQNAADAARVAAQAVTVAASTNETVAKLGESSQEIGNVIKLITSIAEQTNLLALNATIEAARAGEAGKGFAVVAKEVKDLAQETAKATEDISRRVQAIQADTGGAVTAIAEISEVIARINVYQTTIAAAVEEQTATTNEMARNVSEAAAGSQEIASNVVGVATAAEATTTGVSESQRAATDLARMSSELQTLVGTFRY